MLLTHKYSRVSVFNTPLDIEQHRGSGSFFFDVDGIKYQVALSPIKGPGGYHVSFRNVDEFQKGSGPNPFKVMSGVAQVIKEFSESHKVNQLEFVAGSESRAGVYEAMVRRFFPGATYEKTPDGRKFLVTLSSQG